MDDKCQSRFNDEPTRCHSLFQESAEDDCVVAIVGNKTDLCDDDERRPVKYKDGAKLADVNLLSASNPNKDSFSSRNMDVYFSKVVLEWAHLLSK